MATLLLCAINFVPYIIQADRLHNLFLYNKGGQWWAQKLLAIYCVCLGTPQQWTCLHITLKSLSSSRSAKALNLWISVSHSSLRNILRYRSSFCSSCLSVAVGTLYPWGSLWGAFGSCGKEFCQSMKSMSLYQVRLIYMIVVTCRTWSLQNVHLRPASLEAVESVVHGYLGLAARKITSWKRYLGKCNYITKTIFHRIRIWATLVGPVIRNIGNE